MAHPLNTGRIPSRHIKVGHLKQFGYFRGAMISLQPNLNRTHMEKSRRLPILGLTLAFCIFIWSLSAQASAQKFPQRIVSLSPSVTEILYALKLGDKIVGVTRYCQYPPEAKEKPQVGGLLDPGLEAILALKPDLVILVPDQKEFETSLSQLNLHCLEVPQYSLREILDSMVKIGEVCGAERNARRLVASIEAKMDAIRQRISGLPPTRALISVGRDFGSGSLGQVYIGGPGTFYDELLRLAGGVNAYREGIVKYPAVSAEGILRMNPEAILEIAPGVVPGSSESVAIVRDWQAVPRVSAVKEGRVYVFGEDYMTIPGPRVGLILERLAGALHPELKPE
jgi:iron complex transport system substrate-binding protein